MFDRAPPSAADRALAVAEQRMFRAMALQHGLDPDAWPPEDILLLDTDKDGRLLVSVEYERCRKWAIIEAGRPSP